MPRCRVEAPDGERRLADADRARNPSVALVLGWLYVRTGSLWAPIGLHATYNAVLIILAEAVLAR